MDAYEQWYAQKQHATQKRQWISSFAFQISSLQNSSKNGQHGFSISGWNINLLHMSYKYLDIFFHDIFLDRLIIAV